MNFYQKWQISSLSFSTISKTYKFLSDQQSILKMFRIYKLSFRIFNNNNIFTQKKFKELMKTELLHLNHNLKQGERN